LDSGYMIIQLTAASLISENKVLTHPASVDSIPTSANQEDHVSMGSVSAIKLLQVVENVSTVLAIEWMIAAQAIDIREIKSSAALELAKARLREFSPRLAKDRVMYPELHKSVAAIKECAVLKAVEQSGIKIY
ncbi:MAG: aromatic amino acid lyase, partial [Candidatus Cloacimonetes bacterium]|nr:aromatic amino acid lyase [Candidatus Cloacimonadota bacterium]